MPHYPKDKLLEALIGKILGQSCYFNLFTTDKQFHCHGFLEKGKQRILLKRFGTLFFLPSLLFFMSLFLLLDRLQHWEL